MSVAALSGRVGGTALALEGDTAPTLEPEVIFEPDLNGYYVAVGLEDDGRVYLSELINNRMIQRIEVQPTDTQGMIAFLRQSGLRYARFIDWHGVRSGTLDIPVHEIDLFRDGAQTIADSELEDEIRACLRLLMPPAQFEASAPEGEASEVGLEGGEEPPHPRNSSPQIRQPEDINEIFRLATAFRAAVEQCDRARLPVTFGSFPRGSCGDAALLLGRYLKDEGSYATTYFLGNWRSGDNWSSHAWLQQGDIIIDITADQFEGIDAAVIVTRESPFHADLDGVAEHEGDYRAYDPDTRTRLDGAYATILAQIGDARAAHSQDGLERQGITALRMKS